MLRLICILLLPLLFTGCAYLTSQEKISHAQIMQLLQAQQYGKALNTLNHIKPGHPDYAVLNELRENITQQAERYANKTAGQVLQFTRQGKWQHALDLSTSALINFPQNQLLQETHQQLLLSRQEQLAKLDNELLQAHAESLLLLLPIQQRRALMTPGSRQIQKELHKLEQDASATGAELLRLGRLAMTGNNSAEARRYFDLALRLNPSDEAQQAKKDFSRTFKQSASAKKKQVPATKSKGKTKDLLQQYQNAYAQQNWLEAQRLLALLRQKKNPPEELDELSTDLNARVAEAVNQYLAHGNRLYAQEKYELALATWRRANLLKPDNSQINDQISRVERVLDKLRSLQEKQTDK
ncbi:MAG: hypothetical protein WCX90_06075 [Thiohalomonadaceae bacterium]